MQSRTCLIIGWLAMAAVAPGQQAAGQEQAAAGGCPCPCKCHDRCESPPAVADPSAAEDTDTPAAQQADPFAATNWSGMGMKIPAARGAEPRTTLRVRLETWELDAKELARSLDALGDVSELDGGRRMLLENPASVLVYSPLVTVEAKSRATCESIVERIYPTEQEPPAPAGAGKSEPVPGPAVPSAFETRNIGLSFEAAAQPVSAEPHCWDLSVVLEDVRLVAMEPQGAAELGIKMPVFASFKTGGLLRLAERQWQVLSVQEPPRGLDGQPGTRRWVTLVRVERAR